MNALSLLASLFAEGKSYTFSNYFDLNVDIEDLLTHFGYTFQSQNMALPQSQIALDRLTDLRSRIEETLPYLSLTSEIARREFLIAPVLIDVVHYTHAKIKSEYLLEVNDQLKGTLDYYIRAKQNLLVIKAKNADLQKGFTQLAVELIALDQWSDSDAPVLYGAVSTGNIWQFGVLNRQAKQVTQDVNLYRVPGDLEDLLRVLVAVLEK